MSSPRSCRGTAINPVVAPPLWAEDVTEGSPSQEAEDRPPNLEIGVPLEDETLRYYERRAAETWRRTLGRPSPPFDDGGGVMPYGDFRRALDQAGVIVLEVRARRVFESCRRRADDADVGSSSSGLDVTGLEIALMILRLLPTTAEGEAGAYPPPREVFLCYDLDERGTLDYDQFAQCVSTLRRAGGARFGEDGPDLAEAYRSAVGGLGERIDYGAFLKVWCYRLCDAEREMSARGLLDERGIGGGMRKIWKKRAARHKLYEVLKRCDTSDSHLSSVDQIRDQVSINVSFLCAVISCERHG